MAQEEIHIELHSVRMFIDGTFSLDVKAPFNSHAEGIAWAKRQARFAGEYRLKTTHCGSIATCEFTVNR